MNLKQMLALTRYLVLLAVLGTLVGSIGLVLYEMLVVGRIVVDVAGESTLSTRSAKNLAVELIGTIDVFLIAIAAYVTSLGLYLLFVDDTVPLPKWLVIHNLDDLKYNLVSVVIAVLAVLFLREAVIWDGSRNLLDFGVAVAVIILALTVFLAKKGS
ncbi:YqhA family protein [Candidatus Methylocalor cossyra]|uniref:Membrane protein YqhA n=1 Tax=Candidatus Methylocalor cossyra TaxID=3108543 RepID=A0ABM9NMY2_9GAMM